MDVYGIITRSSSEKSKNQMTSEDTFKWGIEGGFIEALFSKLCVKLN